MGKRWWFHHIHYLLLAVLHQSGGTIQNVYLNKQIIY